MHTRVFGVWVFTNSTKAYQPFNNQEKLPGGLQHIQNRKISRNESIVREIKP